MLRLECLFYWNTKMHCANCVKFIRNEPSLLVCFQFSLMSYQ